jgi:predicted RecB family nuclease
LFALAICGGLQPRVLRDLHDMHCETVEDLAAISDGNVTRIVNWRALGEQAIEYLRIKAEQSPEMAALLEQNEKLLARIEALEKAKTAPRPLPAMSRKMEALRRRKAAKREPIINPSLAPVDVG